MILAVLAAVTWYDFGPEPRVMLSELKRDVADLERRLDDLRRHL